MINRKMTDTDRLIWIRAIIMHERDHQRKGGNLSSADAILTLIEEVIYADKIGVTIK